MKKIPSVKLRVICIVIIQIVILNVIFVYSDFEVYIGKYRSHTLN
jgi:hypothetical protein